MTGLFDYAGLFPPAKLDLESAWARYRSHLDSQEGWMLARFVIPVGRLKRLETIVAADHATPRGRWRLTVIVGGGRGSEALERLPGEIGGLRAATGHREAAVAVEGLETRLPPEIQASDDPIVLRDFVERFVAAVEDGGLAGRDLFFEGPPAAGSAAGSDDAAIEGIALAAPRFPGGRVGYKLRCGGETPEDVPTAARVARVIVACRDRGIPLKCTAGLHHPVRRFVAETASVHHGFLNVFGAGVLAMASGMPASSLEACVADESRESFSFSDGGFSWKAERAGIEDVARARRALVIGIGSCSFDEPVNDLRELRLLA
jgi:hypothetical protein